MPPLILVALAVLAIPSAFAATKTVDVTRAGFTPSKVTVEFGDTVTWTNKDNQSHQLLFDQGAWPTSPVLAENQTYSVTFTKSGNFGYRDAFATNRRGTVTVRTGVSIKARAGARRVRQADDDFGRSLERCDRRSRLARGEGVRPDDLHEGRLRHEHDRRSVERCREPSFEHRVPSLVEEREEPGAERLGRAGPQAQASPSGSLHRLAHRSPALHRQGRGRPALRAREEGLEGRQARHAEDREAGQGADRGHLGRLPPARATRDAPAPGARRGPGRSLLRRSA